MKELNIKLTKTCPECEGFGEFEVGIDNPSTEACPTCHGTGEVPNYMTPEEYERYVLNGEKLHPDSPVWVLFEGIHRNRWRLKRALTGIMSRDWHNENSKEQYYVIVAIPCQPKPTADYRHKESEL